MRLIKVIGLSIIILSFTQARVIKKNHKLLRSNIIATKAPAPVERSFDEFSSRSVRPFTPLQNGYRDFPPVYLTDHFRSVQVANSFNGYGLISGSTNPIAYQPDKLNYNDDYGAVFAAFRMFVPDDDMTGYIGVSLSMDGLDWVTSSTPLNQQVWSGQALNGGRYPSAVMSSSGRPTAVWNEYTGDTDCYGDWYPDDPDTDTGGRALYLYEQAADEQNIFDPEGSVFIDLPPQDLMPFNLRTNNGCYAENAPIDLWIGNAFMVDGPNSPVVLAMFQEGLGNGKHYLFYNDPTQTHYISGALFPSVSLAFDPGWLDASGDSLFDDGTTGGPDFHINSDGVGYLVQRAYNNLSEGDPVEATLFFRRTENYGITWSGDDGDAGQDGVYGDKYFYISDAIMAGLSDSLYTAWEENEDTTQLWKSDTIYFYDDPRPFVPAPGFFLWYDYDVRTDMDGGLHVSVATWNYLCPDSAYLDSAGVYVENGCLDLDEDGLSDSLFWEYRYGSVGMVHFYFPEPIENPGNAHASLVHDMSSTYSADWVDNMSLSTGTYGPQQYFFPSITLSSDDNSDVVWYTGSAGTRFEYNSDSSLWSPRDVDLFLSRSTDNGITWSEIENISNTAGTPMQRLVEVGAHISDKATDDDVYILYQMPDFNQPMYEGPTEFEEYFISVHAGYYSTSVLGADSEQGMFQPVKFTLEQNYPNPFNPVTKIQYNLIEGGYVRLDLYDILGVKVKTLFHDQKPAGGNEYLLDASMLSSGVYFYTLDFEGNSISRKMVLLK
ncbi:MAG: hypothetical protein CMG74_10695 [Candidatus Marinimicrobia bacterium]|nr:hypothetical protein [Candidatus Neomarinimicrobiota bacterium]|tara:strand:+ start:137 stop:2458 length:2322 start_codon:yes stop_codon:yes gene_type:complete